MRWAFSEDNTPAVITAEKHVRSSHGSGDIRELPETCVIFELGIALRFLKENFDTVTLYDRLPCFLDNPECIAVKGHPDVCFTKGGYGCPAAVDTLETVRRETDPCRRYVRRVRERNPGWRCGGAG